MKDPAKTKQDLIEEISVLKKKIKKLEKTGTVYRSVESQREDALEVLRKSEERYRSYIEKAPVGVFIADKNGRYLQVNAAASRITGYSRDELLTMNIADILPPESQERAFKHFHQLVETGYARGELAFHHKQDKTKYWSVDAVKLSTSHFMGFVQDITDRKQAESQMEDALKALQKSEQRFRAIFNSTFQFTGLMTPDGRLIEANQAAIDFAGVKLEDFINRPFWETHWWQGNETRVRKLKEAIAKAANGEFIRYEVELQGADDTSGIFDFSLKPVLDQDGEVVLLIPEARDITDRLQAESQKEAALDALRKNEDKYRTLIETTDTGFVIIDQDGLVIDANSEYVRLTGHNALNEIIGKSVMEWTSDYEKEKNAAAVKACFELGYIRNLEIDYVDTKGKVTPIEINASCIEIAGKIQTITICRDITDRKKAEDAMRESETKLQSIFDKVGTGIFIIDRDTLIITEANQTAIEMTGLSKEKIIGQICNSVVCPALAGKCPVKDLGQDIHQSERKLLHADGHQIDILKTVYPLTFNGRNYYLESLIDISDRKQAEETLRISEEKFSKIFHKAPLLMSINDIENGSYLDVNEKWTEVSGFSREEALGKTSLELGFMSREDAVLLAKKLKDQKIIENMEFYLQARNKQQVCCLFSSEVITIGEKQVLLSISQDITEKKKIEEEKTSLEERLQRAEKMEALGTLAGGVAHDLNNVLGVIVGYAELLLHEAGESSSIRPRLTKIMNGSEKAAAIVQDLLTLARRGVPGRKVLNLNKIILDYQNSPELEKLFSYHSAVRIKTNLEHDLLNISGSSVHLVKAMINLVTNAVEAMPQGGELTIKTANQYLDKPIYGYDEVREGDYVVLTVTDTGEGISSDDLQRIFEPFYTKKIMGRSGTGLGLAVVWGTVKDHNGYINVQSEEGRGSTFTLYFPVTRENITSEADAISISKYMGKGETILIVDDVREQRDLAAEMLKKLNYQIASVGSGEAAVEYLKEHKVDLLVLDMIMHRGMDGLDTYKSILKIHPKQKAIIVSGFSESDRVNAAHALGAGAYVKKPYVIEKLGMAVRTELDRK